MKPATFILALAVLVGASSADFSRRFRRDTSSQESDQSDERRVGSTDGSHPRGGAIIMDWNKDHARGMNERFSPGNADTAPGGGSSSVSSGGRSLISGSLGSSIDHQSYDGLDPLPARPSFLVEVPRRAITAVRNKLAAITAQNSYSSSSYPSTQDQNDMRPSVGGVHHLHSIASDPSGNSRTSTSQSTGIQFQSSSSDSSSSKRFPVVIINDSQGQGNGQPFLVPSNSNTGGLIIPVASGGVNPPSDFVPNKKPFILDNIGSLNSFTSTHLQTDAQQGSNNPSSSTNSFSSQGTNSFPSQSSSSFPSQGSNNSPSQGSNSFPLQGSNRFPSQSSNSFPSQGSNSFPLQSSNTAQSQGSNIFPTQGSNSFPSQGSNSFPLQGSNRFPMQSGNSFPSQGSNSFPSQGGNSFPSQGSDNSQSQGNNIFPSIGSNSFPSQGSNSFPSQGSNSFPSQGSNSFPSQGGNSFPSQGSNSFPSQGSNSFPSQGSNSSPSQGSNSFPSQGSNSFPSQGSNSFPSQSSNSFPSQGSNSFPSQGSNSFPSQGSNSFPSQGSNSFPSQGSNSFPSQGSNSSPAQGNSFDDVMSQFPEVLTVVDGIKEFTLDLLSEFRKQRKQGNIVFSPVSITSLLSLLTLSTNGPSRHQIEVALHLPNSQSSNSQHEQYESVLRRLNENSQGINISTSSRLFIEESIDVFGSFTKGAAEHYNCSVSLENFRMRPEQTMQRVNSWVETETQGKITDFLTAPFSPDTIFVAVNTIFFSGDWLTPFPKYFTGQRDFDNGRQVTKIPMMTNVFETPHYYSSELNVDIVSIPYTGGQFAMIVILPRETPQEKSINVLESNLKTSNIEDLIQNMTTKSVSLSLPKMRLSMKSSLVQPLKTLNIKDIFDPRTADFTGLTNRKPLWVSEVLHEAVMEVTEEGTVAAAATAAVLDRIGGYQRVNVNKPAIIFIRDLITGVPLFWTKLTQPEPIS